MYVCTLFACPLLKSGVMMCIGVILRFEDSHVVLSQIISASLFLECGYEYPCASELTLIDLGMIWKNMIQQNTSSVFISWDI